MATSGTSALTNEIKPLYDANYYLQCQSKVYWDQFADLRTPIPTQGGGSSHEFPIVENLQPNTDRLDELEDVAAQQMRVNTASVSVYEYGGAVEVTKLAVAQSYADVCEQAAMINGYNVAESIDYIARATFGQGSRVFFQNARTARSSLVGMSTSADRASAAWIGLLGLLARMVKMPLYEDGCVATNMHPFVLYDLLQDSTIQNMATYGNNPEILFNGEMGYWQGLRIITSANAKGFWGAGGVDATSSLVTTLASAAAVADTNLKLTSVTNLLVGDWISIIDSAETGNTWSDTNELFRVTTVGTAGADGTGVDGFALDPGPGSSGGLRYAHASGKTVNNSNSVYPIPIFGPNSVLKACSEFTGPYGETIVSGPIDRLGRFLTFAWYLIAGYNRARDAWIFRGECGSSQS